jgi:hypothetical protein
MLYAGSLVSENVRSRKLGEYRSGPLPYGLQRREATHKYYREVSEEYGCTGLSL